MAAYPQGSSEIKSSYERIPGYIEEVKKYFNQAAVFCMPTNIEPFGIVFIEAMSMKLPVIGTSIGAIPDFIKNGVNGYMVEPGNSEKLADHLIELLGDPSKCKNFGEEGKGRREMLKKKSEAERMNYEF